MEIGITGASGHIGGILVKALAKKHNLTLYDRLRDPTWEGEFYEVDLSDRCNVRRNLKRHDVLVHLAANPNANAAWDELERDNVAATYNVFAESVTNGTPRIVFASSNHVQHGYACGDRPEILNPEFYKGNKLIKLSDPYCPDSTYATTKIFGEELGKQFAKQFGIQSVALRIGWTVPQDSPLVTRITSAEDYMRAMFLSKRDCVQAFERAIESDIAPGEHVVAYAISNNTKRIFDLKESKRLLGIDPKDDAEKYFGGKK